MKLLKKITPDPILESVVEIRLTSPYPSEVILGMLFNQFKADFPEIKKLPILQLPEAIRQKDPDLIYKPYYQILSKDGLILQIGQYVIGLVNRPANIGQYVGWEEGFFPRITEIFKKIIELGIIENLERVGIRYINFFAFDIYDKIRLKVSLDGYDLKTSNKLIRNEMQIKDFQTIMQISNRAEIAKSGVKVSGSIIDIDTFLSKDAGLTENNLFDKIDLGHKIEKELFQNLLDQAFLTTLNPDYEDHN